MTSNTQYDITPQAAPIDAARAAELQTMKTYSMIVYGLYALGLFAGGLPMLIGLIMAYIKRNDFSGTIYKDHMNLLIRTFWYGLLFGLIGLALTVVYIGFIVLFAVGVWCVYRIVRGFVRMWDGQGAW